MKFLARAIVFLIENGTTIIVSTVVFALLSTFQMIMMGSEKQPEKPSKVIQFVDLI
jgi:hypothetical protein